MSGVVEIVLTPRAVIEVIVEGDDPQPAAASAEVEVVIESPGPQGPPGQPFDIFTLPLAP